MPCYDTSIVQNLKRWGQDLKHRSTDGFGSMLKCPVFNNLFCSYPDNYVIAGNSCHYLIRTSEILFRTSKICHQNGLYNIDIHHSVSQYCYVEACLYILYHGTNVLLYNASCPFQSRDCCISFLGFNSGLGAYRSWYKTIAKIQVRTESIRCAWYEGLELSRRQLDLHCQIEIFVSFVLKMVVSSWILVILLENWGVGSLVISRRPYGYPVKFTSFDQWLIVISNSSHKCWTGCLQSSLAFNKQIVLCFVQ